jgi:hypothetical protein
VEAADNLSAAVAEDNRPAAAEVASRREVVDTHQEAAVVDQSSNLQK